MADSGWVNCEGGVRRLVSMKPMSTTDAPSRPRSCASRARTSGTSASPPGASQCPACPARSPPQPDYSRQITLKEVGDKGRRS